MSDSQRPHGLQPTRLLCPWDFPGKSTGVGCHTRPIKFLFLKKIMYLFIFAVPGLCCCSWTFSSCSEWGARASHCGGFSCCRAQPLGHDGVSSCSTRASVPPSMRTLPGPGIEPMYPALAGRFSTAGLPGKSQISLLRNPN